MKGGGKLLDFGYYNMDCMQGMKEFPDKYFDLAIVDPPYGININCSIGRRKGDKKSEYPKAYWDNEIPNEKYFEELFRVSKKQIIWGGAITFIFHQQNALLFGENRKFQKMLVFQCVNMRGLILTELQKNGLECQMKKTEYTQHKNQ